MLRELDLEIGKVGLIVFLGLYAIEIFTGVDVHPYLIGGAAAVGAVGLALNK